MNATPAFAPRVPRLPTSASHRHYRPGLAIVAALALLWPATVTVSADTIRELEPSTEPIHVRVLFETNPANEAVVAWTTTAEGVSHELFVCTEPRNGNLEAYSVRLPSAHSQPYSLRDDEEAGGMHSWTHNVFLGDLEPATRYYLTAVSDGKASQEFHFFTAPVDAQEVRLLLVGDSRVGGSRTSPDNNRRKVNALMRKLFEEHPNIVAMAHGADYTNRAYWSELYYWLSDHSEVTTTGDGRLLPIIPARGNHDLDIGFEEMFWWPERENEFYYTTHLSSSVAFITLNTEISRGGDQRAWLENELRELRPRVRWLTGQYHRPAWPSVRDFGSGSSQREAWVPLFEKYQVDLVYENHDHALKRTHPIYNNEINEERGIIYVGDGGGGVSQRQPDPDRWYLQVTGRHHHAHMFIFRPDQLEMVAINIDDEVIDELTLTHDRREAVPEEARRAASR